jgi:adenylate cyclase
MALWNTPAPLPDHAAHACAAALEMLDALAPFNARWSARGAPPIAIRIGIHTGAATVGNFGTAQRLEYDARGDAVNLASRLEGLGKQYGATLLISEATRACLDSQFACREIDRVRVLGRARPVGVHEVLGRDAPDAWLQSWDDALSSYRARAWEEAIARFEALVRERPEDGPAQTYLERCRQLSAAPPPTDWDGVFDAHAK